LAAALFCWAVGTGAGQSSQSQLLQDGGFELAPFTHGWVVDPSVASEGKAFRSTTAVHSGLFSLEVDPYASNSFTTPLSSYSVMQFYPATSLRGNPIYFSGYLWARGGATAVLRVWTVGPTVIQLREVRQASGAVVPALLQDVLDVPADDSVVAIAVGCAVEGTTGAAYFDDVTVTTIKPAYVAALSAVQPHDALYASASISPDNVVRQIPRRLYGMNVEWGWDAQGVWDAQDQTVTPRVGSLMQDMGLTELRFPGGILSDLYNWQDGIGDPAKRPGPVVMPGGSLSSNAFGTDEAFRLADAAGANLMITANVLTGTPEEAADWVRYVKAGGHNVKNWEVGNELYLDFTQFVPPRPNWTAEQYAKTFLLYAAAMRAADPSIRLGAGLEYSFSPSAFRVHPGWEATVLSLAAPQIDFVAVHNGFAPVMPTVDAGWDGRTVYAALLASPILIKQSLDALSALIVDNAGPYADHIKVAVTEWGPGFTIEPNTRWVEHPETLGSGIFAADVMKAFIESPRVESAHAFKLADGATEGWIGIRDQAYVAKPVALALQMYSQHFGTRLVASDVTVAGYETRSIGLVDAVSNVPYLDLVCSLDDNGQNLYVIAINKNFDRGIQTSIDLGNYAVNGTSTVWTLNGTAVDANPGIQLPDYPGVTWAKQAGVEPNSRINMGGPGQVGITSENISFSGSNIVYQFPAHSVTSLVLPIKAAPATSCVPAHDPNGCPGGG
jgi:alpha-N-arabinofuranosidase